MKKDEFLDLLDQRLADIDSALIQFEKETEKALSKPPEEGKWSVLGNLEHLHRYNEFYIPEFRKVMKRAPITESQEMQRGRFGMKSAISMLPTESGVDNPMKTFKSKNPLYADIPLSVIDVFKSEQAELKAIISEARNRDIGAIKCKTTLPLIRFRLCDALEFVINHEVRHIAQAKRALESALQIS
ncbi:DinB family protein [Cryomorphaceae bacterium 1068]|nr:DinB family protein [Cryomorphaceae bacterium 1068]